MKHFAAAAAALLSLLLTSCATHMLKPPVIHHTEKIDLGMMQRSTLANGLQLILVPRQSGTVGMTLAIMAGDVSDPLNMSGLSEFTASMLRKGTKKRTAAQIAETIDFVGGSISTSTSDDAVFVQCSARSKDVQVCLDLMTDLILNPTFPQNEIELMKQQSIGELQSAKDSPKTLAAYHAANVYYGDQDVRGRPTSLQSISNINRKAITDFFDRHYAPNNSVLAISGDFDPKMVEKAFGSWKKKMVPKSLDLPSVQKGELKIRVVDKPDATQSTIVIQGPGISRTNKDYYAVELMNYTLGGGSFSSRLMKVVRSEGGKTYGASSTFASGRDPGPFKVSTFTRNSETGATLKLLFREIEKMRASGPNSEELEAAKSNVVGGFGLGIETGSDLASALLGGKIDGLSNNFMSEYVPLMNAVTTEQTRDVAARYLFPTTLVIVGNAKEVVPQLKEMGLTVNETVLFTDPVSASERTKSG